jgi:integrase
MDKAGQPPELFRLMYGEGAARQYEAAGERLKRWAQAFDDWLGFDDRQYWNGESRRYRMRHAWRSFYEQFHGEPWTARAEDVEDWVSQMQARHLAPTTIRQHLAPLAWFYRHAQEKEIDPELPPGFNPARQARQPSIATYFRAAPLLPEEARRLLQAAGAEPRVGKRDAAILLLALRSGLDISEIRGLRRKGLKIEGEAAWLERPGGRPPLRLPDDARQAILGYLTDSGRLEGMQPEEYLFAPLADPLAEATGRHAADWDGQRMVSQARVTALLKACGQEAGLKEVTWPNLKHTAALLQLEAGAEIEELEVFLGRAHNLKKFRLYISRLLRHAKERAKNAPAQAQEEDRTKAAAAQPQKEAPSPEQTYENHLGKLKHGFYARQIPAQDRADLQAHPLKDLSEEMDAARFVMRRAIGRLGAAQTPEDEDRAIDIFLRVAGRLALLFKANLAAQARQGEFEEEFLLAIQDVAAETGWDILPPGMKP